MSDLENNPLASSAEENNPDSVSPIVPLFTTNTPPIGDIVSGALQTSLEEGAMHRILTEAIETAFTKTVQRSLEWGGEGEKLLKAYVDQMFQGLRMEDVPSYQHYILESLQNAALEFRNEHLSEALNTRLTAIFSKGTGNFTLSELFENSDLRTLHIKEPDFSNCGKNLLLYLDECEGLEPQRCRTEVHLAKVRDSGGDEYKVLTVSRGLHGIRGVDDRRETAFNFCKRYGWEKAMAALVALDGTLELDLGLDPKEYLMNLEE